MTMEQRGEVLMQCLWAAILGGVMFNFPGALVGVALVLGLHAANAWWSIGS